MRHPDDLKQRGQVHAGTRIAFLAMLAVSLGSAAGTTAMQSLLPSIGRSTGIADNLVVSISCLSALLSIFAAPFWSRKVTINGEKRITLLGVAGVVLAMSGTGLVIIIGMRYDWSPLAILVALILARALYGVLGLASQPAVQTYIGCRTPLERRTSAMALFASMWGLGSILGPAVAPFLMGDELGLGGPFFAFAVIAFITGLLVWRVVPDTPPVPAPAVKRSSVRELFDRTTAPFILYGAITGIVSASANQTVGFVVIDQLHIAPAAAAVAIGMMMTVGASATLVAQWGLVNLLNLRPVQLMRWGALIGMGGSLLQAAAVDSYPLMMIGFGIVSLGFGMTRPGFIAGASLAVPSERQAEVAGGTSAVGAFGLVIGPMAALTLYQWDRQLPFLLGGALMATMALYAFASPRLHSYGKGHEPPIAPPELEVGR